MDDATALVDVWVGGEEPLSVEQLTPVSSSLASFGIPHIEQYFGVWAVQEEPFRAVVDRLNQLDFRSHVSAAAVNPQVGKSTAAADGARIAVITLEGTLTKYGSSMSGAGSTIDARRQMRKAAADPNIDAIVVRIDSPGGTVSGTQALADDVAAAAAAKPVWAFCEDLCASAAYWIASQASAIYANRTALVGSIGTFAVIQDMSGRAAQLGIKVHVVRAGAHKGDGVPGTEVTHEQLDQWQQMVDGLNEHFLDGVASGRKLDKDCVKGLADGRVHIAQQAQSLGLIDGVQSFDAVLQKLSQHVVSRRSKTMAENTAPVAAAEEQPAAPVADTTPAPSIAAEPAKPAAATYKDIKAACPGANADFLASQLEADATVAQAQAAWMAEQNRLLEVARAETAAAKAHAVKPGVQPLGAGLTSKSANPDASPREAWNAAVKAEMDATGKPKHVAARNVATKHPELRAALGAPVF